MGTNSRFKWTGDRTFLVLELSQTHVGDKEVLEVLVSIPGREGTLRKTWALRQSVLSQPQADDLVAWIATTAANGVLAWTGVQGVLPMA